MRGKLRAINQAARNKGCSLGMATGRVNAMQGRRGSRRLLFIFGLDPNGTLGQKPALNHVDRAAAGLA